MYQFLWPPKTHHRLKSVLNFVSLHRQRTWCCRHRPGCRSSIKRAVSTNNIVIGRHRRRITCQAAPATHQLHVMVFLLRRETSAVQVQMRLVSESRIKKVPAQDMQTTWSCLNYYGYIAESVELSKSFTIYNINSNKLIAFKATFNILIIILMVLVFIKQLITALA